MPQLKELPTDQIHPDPNQPRKLFDEADEVRLGESLKVRQNEPIQVRPAEPGFLIIDGERRWRAARRVGLKKLMAIVTDCPLSATQLAVFRLTSFFHKKDLTGYEKWLASEEMLTLNEGWTQKDLAQALNIDPSMAGINLSPSKCTPAWQEALKEGKVGISDCAVAARLPLEQQDELLALKLSGASRKAVAEHGRRERDATRSGGKRPVKAGKVQALLPSGYTVIVRGGKSGVSLEDAAEALADAIKEMKRAKEMGFTAKTFAAAMKDKATKGGA